MTAQTDKILDVFSYVILAEKINNIVSASAQSRLGAGIFLTIKRKEFNRIHE